MKTMRLSNYEPHLAQQAFHYAIDNMYQFVAMICGIRAGKTYSGARQATKLAWNSKAPEQAVFGIIAPTYNMLDRTTWREFKIAARPLIRESIDSKKIIILKNGREVHGFSADKPDRVRNATLSDFWLDEGRECKDGIWDVLLGRVLSTGGKGILTTSPNSYDWIHDVFIASGDKDYGVVRFSSYDNTYLDKSRIESLERKYDPKFARQELYGEFVIFQGAVYYTFDRGKNAGDLAMKMAQYDPNKPIGLCCDFNVNPMAWVMIQMGYNFETGLTEAYAIDEIYLKNSNTPQACDEFRNRYPNHRSGVVLYGDATGQARHSSSNVTNWQIIQDLLRDYGITNKVPRSNPAERDRVNAVNGLMCNSRNERRFLVNPNKCKHLIRDLEQVSYKDGTTQIEKNKDANLTHISDAVGYAIEKEFSLISTEYKGLKI